MKKENAQIVGASVGERTQAVGVLTSDEWVSWQETNTQLFPITLRLKRKIIILFFVWI